LFGGFLQSKADKNKKHDKSEVIQIHKPKQRTGTHSHKAARLTTQCACQSKTKVSLQK